MQFTLYIAHRSLKTLELSQIIDWGTLRSTFNWRMILQIKVLYIQGQNEALMFGMRTHIHFHMAEVQFCSNTQNWARNFFLFICADFCEQCCKNTSLSDFFWPKLNSFCMPWFLSQYQEKKIFFFIQASVTEYPIM